MAPVRHNKIRQSDYRTNSYFERTPKNNPTAAPMPRWVILLALVVLALGVVAWSLTAAPWLRVKNIRIDGTPTEETKAEIDKLYGHNILWLSVTRPETAIVQKQPSIKQIQILRGIPDTLRVKLIERQPAVIWQSGDNLFTLDPSGFVFKQQTLNKKEDGSYDYPATDLPLIVDTKNLPVSVGQAIVRPQFITFVQQLRDRLPKDVNLHLVRAEIEETSFNVRAVTDAGWSVLFDTTRSIDAQLRTLSRTLESKRNDVHEYVDVRVRGWVYYK